MANLDAFQKFGLGSPKQTHEDNNRCVLYTRVSTKDQEDNTSLANQARVCREYCLRNDLHIVKEFGGKSESAREGRARKEYENLLAFARKKSNNIKYIVFYSYDRFSRQGGKGIYDKDQLRKQGIHIKSATQPIDTESPTGSMMEDFQLLISKADNDLRRSKCVAGQIARLRDGHWVHHAPIGYRWDRNNRIVVIDEEKGPLVKKLFMMKYNDPNLTWKEIRLEIKKKGLYIPPQTVSRMIRNPFYCGLITDNLLEGEIVEGVHEPIVSKEVFLTVSGEKPQKSTLGWRSDEFNNHLPLKRFLHCDNCGKPLTGYVVKAKGIHYYKCKTKGCCTNKNANKLNGMFLDQLNEFTIDEKLKPLIAQELYATIMDHQKEAIQNESRLKGRITELEQQMKKLKKRFVLEGVINREEYDEFAQILLEEKQGILDELENTALNSSNLQEEVVQAVEIASNLPAFWENGDYRTKQRLQQMVYPEGMTYNKKTDSVRTKRVNEVIRQSSLLSSIFTQKNTGINHGEMIDSRYVEVVGFEPTSGEEPQWAFYMLSRSLISSIRIRPTGRTNTKIRLI